MGDKDSFRVIPNVICCDVLFVTEEQKQAFEQNPMALTRNGRVKIGDLEIETSKLWVLSSTDLENAAIGADDFAQGKDIGDSTFLLVERTIYDAVDYPQNGSMWCKSHRDFGTVPHAFRVFCYY